MELKYFVLFHQPRQNRLISHQGSTSHPANPPTASEPHLHYGQTKEIVQLLYFFKKSFITGCTHDIVFLTRKPRTKPLVNCSNLKVKTFLFFSLYSLFISNSKTGKPCYRVMSQLVKTKKKTFAQR